MKVAVASGKGGTGKTTVATNLAYVAAHNGQSTAYLDCDVEEPNGHIFLKPVITSSKPVGNLIPMVDKEKCNHCGKCGEFCRFSAITCLGDTVLVFPELCHSCGGCKLVSLIREEARKIAGQHGLDLVLIDGSPGIGCPVIATVTGADLVLAVTEPTLPGLHDLERILSLTRYFEIPTLVCINKYDLNEDISSRIEAVSAGMDVTVAGRVCYDPAVTKAQMLRSSVIEYTEGLVSQQIRSLWRQVTYSLD